MSQHSFSIQSNSIRKPVFGVVVELLFVCALHVNVFAEEVDAFRARVFKEVLLEIPDIELAKQIVEIRVKREFIKQQTPVAKPSQKEKLAPKPADETQPSIDQKVQGVSNHSAAVTTSTTPKAADQVSGVLQLQSSKGANGIYVGVGNRVVVGYQSAASDNGWSVYADLGLMFGKYDAYARTSMVGLHAVTASDVDAELNNLRTSLFKWSYVPVGAVGIKYRY